MFPFSDERTGRATSPKPSFFHRPSSNDANAQKNEQRDAILAQVRAAQASTFAGQTDQAIRQSRSASRSRHLEPTEGSTQSRSTSHIRNMIKSIANDP